MATAGRLLLPAESPKEFGLDGEPLRFVVWSNAPQSVHDAIWDSFTDEGRHKRVQAFHAFFKDSEPQTVTFEGLSGQETATLDFTTLEATEKTLELDLPDDVWTWVVNLPSTVRMKRREKVGELLPKSLG